jgi:hypothetical protein
MILSIDSAWNHAAIQKQIMKQHQIEELLNPTTQAIVPRITSA